ncbi:ABC transporter ATP-binding protein [Burkholderia plantarii]|uniref:ABC transporter ATP-binding protein n=1 Tax=Burkholderia plantarii TaxID=41899 RepID=UPI0018DE32E9|nr:ABC transporter ATP-binding protein [Burkholderia plantarii]MBI0325527.1 ABC transporter ATP-binding protein [Burkholderia plantarii]
MKNLTNPSHVQAPLPSHFLELKNVNKTFIGQGGVGHDVLHEINLEIGVNEFVSILGKSGSGKSTLLKTIGGLVQPTLGVVSLRGEELTCPHSAISMVFQTFALYPWLTVFENIAFGLHANGIEAPRIDHDVANLIRLIGLQGYEKAFPRELSGGMKQRVGFARALAIEPDLLLLDEPFSSLDMFTAEKLRTDLMAMWTSRKIGTASMIMVTHDVTEAVMMSDRLIVLGSNPGRITHEISIGTPRAERTVRNMLDRIEHVTDLLNTQIALSYA